MPTHSRLLRVGDTVRFDGRLHTVVALEGTAVRLVDEAASASVVLLPHLLMSDGFEVVTAASPRMTVPASGVLEGLPRKAVERAEWWQRHLVEVLTGRAAQLGQEHWPFLADRPDFSGNTPCRLCVARRTGSYSHFSRVSAWSSRFHDQVCLRHKIWTGRSAENYMQQVDVTDLPDVIQAQRRHYRLLRRHGHVVLSACFEHCSDLWDAVVRRGYRPSDRRRRLDTLGTSHPEIWDPRRYIAVYPEVVAATALYASPHWRKLARSDDSGYFQFRIEFIRQLPQERVLRKSSKLVPQRTERHRSTHRSSHKSPS